MVTSRLRKLAILMTLCGFIMAGCAQQPAEKPMPSTQKPSTQAPMTAPKKPVTKAITSTEAKRIADRLSKEAVKVQGVEKAAVLVDTTSTRPNAYVGINLKSGVKGQEATKVKRNVETNLKETEPRLNSVNVTSDPDLIKRIEDISRGIAKGKPISSFSTELRELGRRVVPTTR